MRRASIALLAALIFAIPAAAGAPATKPGADLAKENADLRAYVEKLEARIAELEATLKQQAKPRPRFEVRPLPVPPRGFQIPRGPLTLPAPAPVPLPRRADPIPPNTLRVVPPPSGSVPENWQRREFNGLDFYLVPLK